MSGASDISRLFEMAGGSPVNYQEVEGREQSLGSRGRWTMPADHSDEDLFVWPEDESQEVARDVTHLVDGANSAASGFSSSQQTFSMGRSVRESEPTFEAAPKSSVVQSFSEPVVDMPPPPPLSSVFARLLKEGESRADES